MKLNEVYSVDEASTNISLSDDEKGALKILLPYLLDRSAPWISDYEEMEAKELMADIENVLRNLGGESTPFGQ